MTQDNDGAPSLGQLGTAYLEGLSDGTPTSYTSFELPGIFPIPEPGTMALGVMGACAFLARRRNFLTGVFGGFQMRCKAVFPVMESLIRILATDAQKR